MCAKFKLLLIVTVVAMGGDAWKIDRQPRMFGEKKVPFRNLSPLKPSIRKKILIYHNMYRARVIPRASNMLKLKWNSGAAAQAQKWAEQCHLLQHNNDTDRSLPGYGVCGQNIFVSTQTVPWYFAVRTWYLEKHNFTYGSTENDLFLIGHYTQLVWAASHQIGCGLAKCKYFYNFICNYCPIGNHYHKLGLPYKKGRPCSNCRGSCVRNRLCTNRCCTSNYWSNCEELMVQNKEWLCQTDRMQSCTASCNCKGKIYD